MHRAFNTVIIICRRGITTTAAAARTSYDGGLWPLCGFRFNQVEGLVVVTDGCEGRRERVRE